MSKYKEISSDKIKTYSVKDRPSKVHIKDFMKIDKEVSTKDFIDGLPYILKAVTIVRNLGFPLKNFHTAVFDMNLHYRPMTNIVKRPPASGGKGYYFVGHHEIMIPLFWWSLLEKI